MFPNITTVATKSTRDSYGKYSYGTAVAYNTAVHYKNQKVMKTNGEELISTGYVIFETNPIIDVDSLITLPDGRQPLIATVERHIHNSDLNYTKIFFI